MVFVEARTLEEITKEIIKDAEQCAAKCWWEAHDKKNYVKAGELFAGQEEIIAKYAGNKPKSTAAIANCFALTLQTYDNFTEVLKTGDGTIEDLEKQLREMLFDVYETLNTDKETAKCYAEAARHNMEWWLSFARMRLAQKQMAKATGQFEKEYAEEQYHRYGAIMSQHMTDEHRARYGSDEDTAKGCASLLQAAGFLGHHKRNYVKAKQLLKTYCIELFSTLAEKQH